ncbi:MAG: tetratricopeptide repeat protein [Candidatus Omnitrophota bacterium]|nr:tetratricopeptide repeat protein [Candidatus Omnitrophota bacterium]
MRSKSVLMILAWLVLTILIAPKIGAYNQAFMAGRAERDVPVFLRLFGEGRNIVSNLSVMQADLYFHGGVAHVDCDHMRQTAMGQADIEDEHGEGEKRPELSPFNILFRISEQTEITSHVHLHGDRVKEVIPWLYYSAEIDPHNVMAYTLTAFYLADRLNKVSEGIAFLREGLRNNPESWQINAEIGRIYFEHFRNYEAAERYLKRAMELQRKVPHDKFQERYVLSFLAYTYQDMGREKDALPLYRRLEKLFPKSKVFKEKIMELSSLKQNLEPETRNRTGR